MIVMLSFIQIVDEFISYFGSYGDVVAFVVWSYISRNIPCNLHLLDGWGGFLFFDLNVTRQPKLVKSISISSFAHKM